MVGQPGRGLVTGMFSNNDPRLAKLLDGIVRLASGELHSRIEISEARDELDAVIMGTNLSPRTSRSSTRNWSSAWSHAPRCSTPRTRNCSGWP
jgi:hypothetical protein